MKSYEQYEREALRRRAEERYEKFGDSRYAVVSKWRKEDKSDRYRTFTEAKERIKEIAEDFAWLAWNAGMNIAEIPAAISEYFEDCADDYLIISIGEDEEEWLMTEEATQAYGLALRKYAATA